LGGGLGIPYRPEQVPLDLKAVGKLLDEFKLYTKEKHPNLQLMIEPGMRVNNTFNPNSSA